MTHGTAQIKVTLLFVAIVHPETARGTSGDYDGVAPVFLENAENFGWFNQNLFSLDLIRFLGDRAKDYRLNPWYSSPTNTATGRLVCLASSKAIEMRALSKSCSTR